MSIQWFDQKIWEVCKQAEVWWAERMPAIKEMSDKRLKQWQEEQEHKERWRVMVI